MVRDRTRLLLYVSKIQAFEMLGRILEVEMSLFSSRSTWLVFLMRSDVRISNSATKNISLLIKKEPTVCTCLVLTLWQVALDVLFFSFTTLWSLFDTKAIEYRKWQI